MVSVRILRQLLLVLTLSTVAQGQGARLIGSVLDSVTGKPLPGAEVTLPDAHLSARANWSGDFQILGIPAGAQLVTIRRLGYASFRARLQFRDGATIDRDFLMEQKAAELDSVTVQSTAPSQSWLREFEQRRADGFGHFITRPELQKNESRRMSEILAQLPGAWIIRGYGGDAWISSGRGRMTLTRDRELDRADRLGRGAPRACYAIVWLDGVLVYGGRDKEPLFNLNSLSATDIAGIEYYAGGAQLPVKFNSSNSACGVLVIWTRIQ